MKENKLSLNDWIMLVSAICVLLTLVILASIRCESKEYTEKVIVEKSYPPFQCKGTPFYYEGEIINISCSEEVEIKKRPEAIWFNNCDSRDKICMVQRRMEMCR